MREMEAKLRLKDALLSSISEDDLVEPLSPSVIEKSATDEVIFHFPSLRQAPLSNPSHSILFINSMFNMDQNQKSLAVNARSI